MTAIQLREELLTTIAELEAIRIDKEYNSNYIHITSIPPNKLYREPKEVQQLCKEYSKVYSLLLDVYVPWLKETNNPSKTDSLPAIGEFFSITRERIRQIQETATRKLKHPISRKAVKRYAETVNELEKEDIPQI